MSKKRRSIIILAMMLIAIFSIFYLQGCLRNDDIAESDIDIPADNTPENGIDISIDNIPENEVVCVGKIELEEGVSYMIDISIESGDKVFVALGDSDDITDAQGIEWKQYFEITGSELQHTFTDIEIGNFYVYVGNKGTPLEHVKGKLSIVN